MFVINNNSSIKLNGSITADQFNNSHITPVPIVEIAEPFQILFFSLFFYRVNTDFQFDVSKAYINISGGSWLHWLDISGGLLAANFSIMTFVPLPSYNAFNNTPFASPAQIELSLSNALLAQGDGSIRFVLGYTYL